MADGCAPRALAGARLLDWPALRVEAPAPRAFAPARLVHARVLRALACASLVQVRGHPRSCACPSRACVCPSRSGARASSLNRPRLARWHMPLSFRREGILAQPSAPHALARGPLVQARTHHPSCACPSHSSTGASSLMRPRLTRWRAALSFRHERIIADACAPRVVRVLVFISSRAHLAEAAPPRALAYAPLVQARAHHPLDVRPRAPARALLVQARAHHPSGMRPLRACPCPFHA